MTRGQGDPDWLDSLSREQQARVIAYYRILQDPKGNGSSDRSGAAGLRARHGRNQRKGGRG